jgi:hypothetical protein
MKLIRLPSGPLACVYPVEQDAAPESRGKDSGVYRAFSGSVEADGESEDKAIQALDERVRRLSQPPPADLSELDPARQAANDVAPQSKPGLADTSGRYRRYSEFDTQPAPASSSRG